MPGPHEASRAAELVAYQDGSIVSRTVLKNEGGSVTLFAFDKSQIISEHSVPYDAVVFVLDGEAEIQVGGAKNSLGPGSLLIMPANVPHAVKATAKFKMLLTMVKASQ